MNRTAKDFTPEEIATRIEEAMNRAFTLFPAAEVGDMLEYAEAAGVDPNLVALSGYGLGYHTETRLAFSLGYGFRLEISALLGYELIIKCVVTWASGGGSPTEAVAQASLHLEAAQKAAQCHMMVTDALSAIRVHGKDDSLAFAAGINKFNEKVEAAHDAVQVVYEAAQRCPGCARRPGQGITATCYHPEGCGHARNST